MMATNTIHGLRRPSTQDVVAHTRGQIRYSSYRRAEECARHRHRHGHLGYTYVHNTAQRLNKNDHCSFRPSLPVCFTFRAAHDDTIFLIYDCADFAREHPDSIVIGQDISMIQPTDTLPPNCTFVREDTEEPWVFDRKFDYIHWRLMLTCCMCPYDRFYDAFSPYVFKLRTTKQ